MKKSGHGCLFEGWNQASIAKLAEQQAQQLGMW
jgi:hypothetical protein